MNFQVRWYQFFMWLCRLLQFHESTSLRTILCWRVLPWQDFQLTVSTQWFISPSFPIKSLSLNLIVRYHVEELYIVRTTCYISRDTLQEYKGIRELKKNREKRDYAVRHGGGWNGCQKCINLFYGLIATCRSQKFIMVLITSFSFCNAYTPDSFVPFCVLYYSKILLFSVYWKKREDLHTVEISLSPIVYYWLSSLIITDYLIQFEKLSYRNLEK